MIKTGIFLISSLLATSTLAHELHEYNEAIRHINEGKQITASIDFSACTPSVPNQAFVRPDAIAVTKDHLAFSTSHLTTNHPGYPGKAVLENLTYRLNQSGEFKIIIRNLDPQTFERIDNGDFVFLCDFTKSAHLFAE